MKQMKTVLRKILVVAVMLGTFTGYANTLLKDIPTFNNVDKRNYISVTDTSGDVIYKGNINYDDTLKNLYDFSQLKDGIYIIELNKDFEIEINPITVKDGVVTFLKDFKEKIFKPVFRSENSKVLISKLDFDSVEMTVELYYEEELIYEENVKGNKILNRVYQLDETQNGDYKAIIRSNDRVYIENFRI
jgi:hypothetical protein